MTDTSSTIQSILNDKYGTYSSVSSTASTSTTSITTSTSSTAAKGSLYTYLSKVSENDVDARTIFKDLSKDAGGDGTTITKDELSSYIDKAEKGSVSTTSNELSAMKSLYENWDEISNGDNSIMYSDVLHSNNKDTLLSMYTSSTSSTSTTSTSSSSLTPTQLSNLALVKSALTGTVDADYTNTLSSSSSSYAEKLKEVLAGTSSSDKDSDSSDIDKLTSLLLKSSTYSTMETEA